MLSCAVTTLWRVDPFLGNARNIHAANNTRAVFSVVRAGTVAMQRTLNTFSRTRWHHITIERLYFLLWSVSSSYKGQHEVFSVWSAPCPVLGSGPIDKHYDMWHMFSVLRGPCCGYIREYGNGKSVELSAGYTYGMLVVEEELEVSMWRLSVWVEDVVT
jgi:hypothetical protein